MNGHHWMTRLVHASRIQQIQYSTPLGRLGTFPNGGIVLVENLPAYLAVGMQTYVIGSPLFRIAQYLIRLHNAPEQFRISGLPVVGVEALRHQSEYPMNGLGIGFLVYLQNLVVVHDRLGIAGWP